MAQSSASQRRAETLARGALPSELQPPNPNNPKISLLSADGEARNYREASQGWLVDLNGRILSVKDTENGRHGVQPVRPAHESDFDGMTDPPDDLKDPGDLPNLSRAL